MNAFVTPKLFHLTRCSIFFLMVKGNITCNKKRVLPINKMKIKPIIHIRALLPLSFGNPGGQSIPDPSHFSFAAYENMHLA
jgi:hypothetical protein